MLQNVQTSNTSYRNNADKCHFINHLPTKLLEKIQLLIQVTQTLIS